MPIHSGNDVYSIIYEPLGINAQYAEVAWDMDLQAGDKMSHRARRVVSLVAAQDPSIINDSVEVTGALQAGNIAAGVERDRKSVVEGKSVSVRVDLGGRRIVKKKRRTSRN